MVYQNVYANNLIYNKISKSKTPVKRRPESATSNPSQNKLSPAKLRKIRHEQQEYEEQKKREAEQIFNEVKNNKVQTIDFSVEAPD